MAKTGKLGKTKQTKHLGLRVPQELHGALVASAKKNLRSLHSQVIFLLQQALREEK